MTSNQLNLTFDCIVRFDNFHFISCRLFLLIFCWIFQWICKSFPICRTEQFLFSRTTGQKYFTCISMMHRQWNLFPRPSKRDHFLPKCLCYWFLHRSIEDLQFDFWIGPTPISILLASNYIDLLMNAKVSEALFWLRWIFQPFSWIFLQSTSFWMAAVVFPFLD